jgi:hypothetical protein
VAERTLTTNTEVTLQGQVKKNNTLAEAEEVSTKTL